jgi:ABC-type multidrug transport system fused ATPase/permease subunit
VAGGTGLDVPSPLVRRLPLTDPGRPDLRSPERFLWWVARGQWRPLAVGIAWGIAWMGVQALVPGALGAGVQAVVDGDPGAALQWGGVVLALGVTQAGAGIMRHRAAVTNWLTAASRTQQLVARQAAHLGGDLADQVSTGEVVTVTASDVERIGSAFDVTARFAGAIVSFLVVAALLIGASPLLGVIVLVGVPLLSSGVVPLVRPLERREAVQRERVGQASARAADTVAGLRVLRGIGGEALFLDRFTEASQRARAAGVATAVVRSVLDALQVALPGVLVVVVTALAAGQVAAGSLQPGALVAFYGYTAFLVLPLRTLTEAAQKAASARVAARRVVRVLSLQRRRVEPQSPAAEPPRGDLVDPVTGLVVRHGWSLGIASADPALASALARRLADVRHGSDAAPATTLAGTRVAELATDVLRRRVILQDTDPVLLSGSVEHLLDVPRSGRVSAAAAVAGSCSQDVLDGLGGFDAHLPERGRSLSGGQRQRLALARSLRADPDVLVLSEPTSAVDAHTEAAIASALSGLREGRTTVVTTTSPLVLASLDEVVLMDEEGVVVRGHHTALMADDRYRAVVTREDS